MAEWWEADPVAGQPQGKPQPAPAGSNWWDSDPVEAPTPRPQQVATPTSNTAIDDVMQGPVGRFGVNVAQGALQLPGLPVEAIVAGGNFVRRQLDLPETRLEDSPAKDWGARGWLDFAGRTLGKTNLPAPKNDFERGVDKAGQFIGGGLPFGPAGLAPSASAFLGSEVGRATDKAGLTGGYGETVGALVGGAAPGLVRGQTTAGLTGNAPTRTDLRTLSDASYLRAEQAGVIVNQSGLNRAAHGIRSDLGRLAYRPRQQPAVTEVLDELDTSLQAGNVTLKDIDSLRQVATNNLRATTNAVEKNMLGKVIERLDDMLDTLQPHELVAGNAPAAVAALKEARGFWKQMRKAEIIDDALESAELRAASTGTGGNVDNAIRQNVRALLTDKRKRAQFTKEEQRLMVAVSRGSATHNLLRGIGGLSPDKGMIPLALSSALAGGIVTGGVSPLAAAAIPAAMLARRGAESLTKRNVARLSEGIRQAPKAAPAGTQAQRVAAEARRRAALAAQSAVRGATGTLTYQEPELRTLRGYTP